MLEIKDERKKGITELHSGNIATSKGRRGSIRACYRGRTPPLPAFPTSQSSAHQPHTGRAFEDEPNYHRERTTDEAIAAVLVRPDQKRKKTTIGREAPHHKLEEGC